MVNSESLSDRNENHTPHEMLQDGHPNGDTERRRSSLTPGAARDPARRETSPRRCPQGPTAAGDARAPAHGGDRRAGWLSGFGQPRVLLTSRVCSLGQCVDRAVLAPICLQNSHVSCNWPTFLPWVDALRILGRPDVLKTLDGLYCSCNKDKTVGPGILALGCFHLDFSGYWSVGGDS